MFCWRWGPETRRPGGSAGFKRRRRQRGGSAPTSAEREPLLSGDAAGRGGRADTTSPGSSSRMEKRGSGRGGHEAAYNLIHLWQRGGSDGRDSSSFIKKTTAAPPW